MAAADIPGCLALWKSSEGLVLRIESDNESALARFLERNPGLSFVAESEGKLVGNVLCGQDGRRGHLYHVVVAPDFRRAGCASAMLDAAVKALAQQGITRCHAYVRPRNLTALKFWNARGGELRNDLRVVTLASQTGRSGRDGRSDRYAG